jgi:hypothetical protein
VAGSPHKRFNHLVQQQKCITRRDYHKPNTPPPGLLYFVSVVIYNTKKKMSTILASNEFLIALDHGETAQQDFCAIQGFLWQSL